MTAKALSERIRDLEREHRANRSEHDGCDVCILFNRIEIALAQFEEKRLYRARYAADLAAPSGSKEEGDG